jgi:hypothetical protein
MAAKVVIATFLRSNGLAGAPVEWPTWLGLGALSSIRQGSSIKKTNHHQIAMAIKIAGSVIARSPLYFPRR